MTNSLSLELEQEKTSIASCFSQPYSLTTQSYINYFSSLPQIQLIPSPAEIILSLRIISNIKSLLFSYNK